MADIAFVSFVRLDMKGQVEPNTLNFEIWMSHAVCMGMLQIFANIVDDWVLQPILLFF